MKKALFIIALIALAQFVTAAVYQQNATSIHISDDFSDFNISRWYLYNANIQNNSWRPDIGKLLHNVDYVNTTGLIDAIYLVEPGFEMSPKDEWNITFKAYHETGDTSSRLWFYIQDNTAQAPVGADDLEEYIYLEITGSDYTTFHGMQSLALHERYNDLAISILDDTETEFSIVKRNIAENNTWYIEVYKNGVLQANDSSVFLNNPGFCGTEPFCPRTIDNFTQTTFYFGIASWCVGNGYNQWIDDLEINVDRAYTCTPDWQCSGYGSCNTSNQAPCNAVTDMNACGDTYSGDYSEFSPQSCDYCAFSVTHPITGDTSTCDVYGYPNNTAVLSNFATCCNVTKLASDCLCDNGTVSLDYRLGTNYAYCIFGFDEADIVPETWYLTGSCGGYQNQYTSADITPAAIDGLTIFIITIVGLAGLIALYVGASFAYRQFWRRK